MAAALIGMWALVGTAAGMFSGAVFRTSEQATANGPAVGTAFGMVGGCMWPLEIVPQSVRLVGHTTPHTWAVDAWVTLLSRGGDLVDIAGSRTNPRRICRGAVRPRILSPSQIAGHAMRCTDVEPQACPTQGTLVP